MANIESIFIPRGGLKELRNELNRTNGSIVKINNVEMGWIEVVVAYNN